MVLSAIFEVFAAQIIPQMLKKVSTKAVDAWIFKRILINLNKLGNCDWYLIQNRFVLIQSSSSIFSFTIKLPHNLFDDSSLYCLKKYQDLFLFQHPREHYQIKNLS